MRFCPGTVTHNTLPIVINNRRKENINTIRVIVNVQGHLVIPASRGTHTYKSRNNHNESRIKHIKTSLKIKVAMKEQSEPL